MSENLDKLLKMIEVNSKFNQTYKLQYFEPTAYNRICELLSLMRRNKEFEDPCGHRILSDVFKHNYRNYFKIKHLESLEPRKIAQKFIGKKNVRLFILNRDNNKCLKCSKTNKLQLDHIIPISKEGKNILSNLQTLCNSCNSKKRDVYADYRIGSRQINYKRYGR